MIIVPILLCCQYQRNQYIESLYYSICPIISVEVPIVLRFFPTLMFYDSVISIDNFKKLIMFKVLHISPFDTFCFNAFFISIDNMMRIMYVYNL